MHAHLVTSVVVVAFLLIGQLTPAENKLNLFIWSEYIPASVIKDFEKEFECEVTVDLYEDAESMLAKLQHSGGTLFDVVVPPDHMVPAMIGLKLLSPLRHEKLPNLKNVEDRFVSPPYDEGNRYTVPYQWGTAGVFMRTNGSDVVPDSWGVVFDPKLQNGSFVMIDSARDLIGAALKYKGFSLNSTDPGELKIARDLIIAAKKRSVGFDGSVGSKNKVLARTARAAMVYSGEGVKGEEEDSGTVFFIPKEGSQIWVDNLAIPAGAPHREMAEKFIDFLLRGKVGAEISELTRFATPNKAARPFLKPEHLNNPGIYPPEPVRQRLEMMRDLGAKNRLYDEVWAQIKAR